MENKASGMTCKWENISEYQRKFKGFIGEDGSTVVQDTYIVVIPKHMSTTQIVESIYDQDLHKDVRND